MTGHSEDLQDVLWADAELTSIRVDYDEVVVLLTESTGRVRRVRCRGYIAYQAVGFWDEMVVESGGLQIDHELLSLAQWSIRQRLGDPVPDSGQLERNRRLWKALVIRLSDGLEVVVVANEFRAE